MLSFLREQGIGDLLARKPAAPALASQEAAGSKSPDNGTQKTQEQEYLTVATQNKNTRKSTVFLAVLFGIGLLCLWLMIKKSAPQQASAASVGTEETQIEQAIIQLTGVKSEMFSNMDQILRKFYEFSDVLQVQVDELLKNPFELELFLANLKGKVGAEEKTLKIDSEMATQQQIREAAKGMQLLSIMHSQQSNCCMIDNKILYEGDSIRGFKVSQIGENFVKLRWAPNNGSQTLSAPSENVEIILKLSE
jgi:preprotein translocase subunit SecG